MSLPIHQTVLKDVANKSGEYPVALQDAVELLVQEQPNLVPLYMYGGTHTFGQRINELEARVKAAERISEAEGNIEARRMRHAIDSFRGKIKKMVEGMTEYNSDFVFGVLWSDDLISSQPSISKPEDPQFSFRFRPKTFSLGLTGRLLRDGDGRTFAENLSLDCDIYDAYHLALELRPQKVVAIDSHGKQTVVYEADKEIGRLAALGKPHGRVSYVFSEDQLERMRHLDNLQVLPTGGLNVVFSDFWEQVKRYEHSAMLFGHQYANIDEFLAMVTLTDPHFIWRYSATDRSLNTPLIDCQRHYGLKNEAREMPENKNRLQFMPSKANLFFDRTSLWFDKATGVQALTSLGDVVTDIWFEPLGRNWDKGWVIVYDKRRGITPDREVYAPSNAEMERYHVLKDATHRYRDQRKGLSQK